MLAAPSAAASTQNAWTCPACRHGSPDPRDEAAHLDAHRQLSQFLRAWDVAVAADRDQRQVRRPVAALIGVLVAIVVVMTVSPFGGLGRPNDTGVTRSQAPVGGPTLFAPSASTPAPEAAMPAPAATAPSTGPGPEVGVPASEAAVPTPTAAVPGPEAGLPPPTITVPAAVSVLPAASAKAGRAKGGEHAAAPAKRQAEPVVAAEPVSKVRTLPAAPIQHLNARHLLELCLLGTCVTVA